MKGASIWRGPSQERRWLLPLLLAVMAAATGIPQLQRNSSVEALVPRDSDALHLRETVREKFGLKDPIVVALDFGQPGELWTPAALGAVRQVTQRLQNITGVDPEQVFSLSTQQWVRSEADALIVAPLLAEGPITESTPAQVQRALAAMPMAVGTLVAADGSAALIVAELRNNTDPGDLYPIVIRSLEALALPAHIGVHVAGEGTSSGYLARYIDRDTRVLTPICGVLMLVLLGLCVRSRAAVLAGGAVLLGTSLATLGSMGWLGSPLYIITSCLPAILLCVAISDSIHYVWRVRRLLRLRLAPDLDAALSQAREQLWRPLLLTSLTTVAGFVGLAASSSMQPMRDYGLYAALGVMVAWALTLVLVPAVLRRCTAARTLEALQAGSPMTSGDRRAALPAWLDAIAEHPGRVIALGLAVTVIAGLASTRVIVDEERILNFGPEAPVLVADRLLNQRFAGTHYLDVYLQAPEGRSLTEPAVLQQIDLLQGWMRDTGGFGASSSFVDIVRAVSASAAGTAPHDTPLPASQDEVEQFLFLYEVSGKPGDLRQEIDAQRRHAYVRGHLTRNAYRHSQPIIAALEAQLAQRFAPMGISAQVTGPVHLTAAWFAPLLDQTLTGMLMALVGVFLLAAAMLRSWTQGLLCLIPVTVAVLAVFGVMGALGIWLSVATSMFASIGIGLGVDFAIHVLHSLDNGRKLGLRGAALTRWAYADSGVPLSANALILVVGFSVTTLSSIPPLRSFGLLVATTVIGSYLAALLILPAAQALWMNRCAVLRTDPLDAAEIRSERPS